MNTTNKLESAKLLVEGLEKLLRQEQAISISKDMAGLNELLVEKQRILEKVSVFEPILIEANNKNTMSEQEALLLAKIKELLVECRELNRETSQITSNRAYMIGKSIAYLESLLNIDSVKLYDTSGKTSSEPGKRNLGFA